jgi:hypothetical protein
VIGVEASSVRRAVGPVAWAVLECLAERAVARDDETLSSHSIRRLSDELQLAKDTVARALRRLVDERLVSHVATRNSGGHFDAGSYRLHLPHDVLVPLEAASHRSNSRPRERPTRSRRAQTGTQLTLIDPERPG